MKSTRYTEEQIIRSLGEVESGWRGTRSGHSRPGERGGGGRGGGSGRGT